MDKGKVMQLSNEHKKLNAGFENICEILKRFFSDKEDFLGFRYERCEDGDVIFGFGRSIFFRWRFIIHDGVGFGILGSSTDVQPETSNFHEIYFRGEVPVFVRNPGQNIVEFYGNQLMDMETLLAEIIGEFLKQECFKP